MRRYRKSTGGGLQAEYLPAYAPELNPVEHLWSYWKRYELANVCPREYLRMEAHARIALKRMKSKRKRLVTAFWKQAELCFG